MFRVTEPDDNDQTEYDYTVYTLSYQGLVSSIIHPAGMLLTFLLPIAFLNQSCEYLKKVAYRFVVSRRNESESRNQLKTLMDFVKEGDFALRVSGFLVTTSSAWSLFVLISSAFFTLIRVKTVV